MDGTGSGLCPVSGLGISGVAPAITISSGLISQLSESVSKHEKILFYFHMRNTVFHLFTKSTKNLMCYQYSRTQFPYHRPCHNTATFRSCILQHDDHISCMCNACPCQTTLHCNTSNVTKM
jgi:hypothetical protein